MATGARERAPAAASSEGPARSGAIGDHLSGGLEREGEELGARNDLRDRRNEVARAALDPRGRRRVDSFASGFRLREVRVDGHLHVFLSQREDPGREVSELAPAERQAPVELLLETMAAYGIDGAVLVPLGPERAYVARCLERFPGLFVGVCVADESLHAEPERELRERAAAGFLGVRMGRLGEPGRPLRESPVYPTLAAMAAEGLVLWHYMPPEQLPLLREALELLPTLTVCLNHLGFCPERMDVDEHGRPQLRTPLPPATLPAVLELAGFPRVHVMLSGLYGWSEEPFPYRDLTGVVQTLYESYGAERLFWASDFPWILEEPGYGALLELPDIHLPNLADAERADIFGGTVGRIFPRAFSG